MNPMSSLFSSKEKVLLILCFLLINRVNAQVVSVDNLNFDMVKVVDGTFQMGSENKGEGPIHQVQLDGFWISKYEITWEQYEKFVFEKQADLNAVSNDQLKKLGIDGLSRATPPYVDMSFGMGKKNRPATGMTQYAALMFCKWLSAKTGKFYRLPTEAEWEYVCKKGNTDKLPVDEVAWFADNSGEKYAEIGLKKPNEMGLYDLLGNVSEWTMDQYDETFYAKSSANSPWKKPDELYPRVTRGGDWKSSSEELTCTYRKPSKSAWKKRDPQIPKSNWWLTNASFIGFRIVQPVNQPSAKEIANFWLTPIEDFTY